MGDLHSLSLQLFELLQQYEEVIKEEDNTSDAEGLRSKIREVEFKLKIQKAQVRTH
jgi:hypothetical protein